MATRWQPTDVLNVASTTDRRGTTRLALGTGVVAVLVVLPGGLALLSVGLADGGRLASVTALLASACALAGLLVGGIAGWIAASKVAAPHRSQPGTAPTPPPTPAERRGPNRARNVVRPDFLASTRGPVAASTGRDGEGGWESF